MIIHVYHRESDGVYHADFGPEPGPLSHWHSRGEQSRELVVEAAKALLSAVGESVDGVEDHEV